MCHRGAKPLLCGRKQPFSTPFLCSRVLLKSLCGQPVCPLSINQYELVILCDPLPAASRAFELLWRQIGFLVAAAAGVAL